MNWSEEELADHYRKLCTPPSDLVTASNKSETDIQEECVKLMQEDGWRALRTDPVSDRGRGKGFGELGMADYLFLRDGVCPILWVEFKSRKGILSSKQVEWHRNERARGFRTWIASLDFPASVEGFRAHYAASGLQRFTGKPQPQAIAYDP